jgi:alcohol dehydrogenase (cytochrome c)
MAPQFVAAAGGRPNLVIVGVSGGEFEVRGQVVAYNADTGAEVWGFFTTAPGTWGGDSWKTGAATLWNTPAVDPELGLLYFNTGNAAPDINGVRRIGQNLYSASIVALDIATGRVRWFFQQVHHDLWDYDSAQPVMLFPVARGGQALPALGECSKNGNYYILDRRTGQSIFPVQEVPVPTQPAWQHPWPTQPLSSVEPLTPLSIVPGTVDFSKLPKDIKIAPQYTPPQQQKLLISPGDDGGCEWPPAAFSPRTGFVYYGTRYEPSTYQTFPGNRSFLGSAFEEVIPGVTDFGLFGAPIPARAR